MAGTELFPDSFQAHAPEDRTPVSRRSRGARTVAVVLALAALILVVRNLAGGGSDPATPLDFTPPAAVTGDEPGAPGLSGRGLEAPPAADGFATGGPTATTAATAVTAGPGPAPATQAGGPATNATSATPAPAGPGASTPAGPQPTIAPVPAAGSPPPAGRGSGIDGGVSTNR